MRDYRRAKRVREIRQFVSQTRRADSIQVMSGLVNGMVARLGGIDRFCLLWAESMKTATPTMQSRGFWALAKMAQLIASQRNRQ
jgi:nitrate/nitrite transporter NarK